MKKIITSAALLSLGAYAAHAQLTTSDLSVSIISPQPNTKFLCTDDITIEYKLKNNGPNAFDLVADPAILIGIQCSMDSTYKDGNGDGMVTFNPIGNFALGVNEEITAKTRTRKVEALFNVWAAPYTQGDEPIIFRDNLRNGHFLIYVETIGFGNGDANNVWQEAANYEDPDNTNNMSAVIVEFDRCDISVKEINANTMALQMYPNPAVSGLTQFEFEFKGNETATVRVYDVTGRTVLIREVTGTGVQAVQLDVTSLNAGMYNMEIATADRRGVSKFTVAK